MRNGSCIEVRGLCLPNEKAYLYSLNFYIWCLILCFQGEFDDLSDRAKRQRTETLRASTSTAELTHAAQMKLRASGEKDAAEIVRRTIEASPKTLKLFLNFIKEKDQAVKTKKVISYTLPEALAYQYKLGLGKERYNVNKRDLASHNVKIFPVYEKLTLYRMVRF